MTEHFIASYIIAKMMRPYDMYSVLHVNGDDRFIGMDRITIHLDRLGPGLSIVHRTGIKNTHMP